MSKTKTIAKIEILAKICNAELKLFTSREQEDAAHMKQVWKDDREYEKNVLAVLVQYDQSLKAGRNPLFAKALRDSHLAKVLVDKRFANKMRDARYQQRINYHARVCQRETFDASRPGPENTAGHDAKRVKIA
jgi:hypothetical protein